MIYHGRTRTLPQPHSPFPADALKSCPSPHPILYTLVDYPHSVARSPTPRLHARKPPPLRRRSPTPSGAHLPSQRNAATLDDSTVRTHARPTRLSMNEPVVEVNARIRAYTLVRGVRVYRLYGKLYSLPCITRDHAMLFPLRLSRLFIYLFLSLFSSILRCRAFLASILFLLLSSPPDGYSRLELTRGEN